MTILLATSALTLAAFTLIWVLSLQRKDASIVDLYWGPGFAVITWLGLWMSGSWLMPDFVFTLAVTIWAVRLGWYMTMRHDGTEDPRYAAMRARHGEGFGRRSLWMVFWLQAAIQWLAASPSLVVMTAPTADKAGAMAAPLQIALVMLGSAFFVVGLVIEIMADRAVARFRANPANRGQLLTTGLHSHVRHPNYLGEILLQWGLGFFAFGLTLKPLAFVGPALMMALIIRLSGVPMLEAQMAQRPGFAAWKASTGALWPRFGGR